MVLSEDVQRAAFEGDLETITAWMASNDVNDTVVATPHRFNANSRSTLLKLIVKRATKAGASQVSVLPLARAVIARGADLELSNSGCPPLHLAAESRGYESVAMCSLLIEAGADVNQKAYESKTPLGVALDSLRVTPEELKLGSSASSLTRTTLEVVCVLLRAGASLDGVNGTRWSAEQVLDLHLKNSNRSWNRQRLSYAIRLSDDENVHAILYLLHGVRAAGSWRGFLNTRYYQPLARLRGLASRGHATTEDRMLALLFALPHRPFRVVLSYWRVLPSWFFSPRSIRGANN